MEPRTPRNAQIPPNKNSITNGQTAKGQEAAELPLGFFNGIPILKPGQTGESSSSDLNLGHSPSTFRTQPSKSRQCVGGCAHFFSPGVQGPLTWLFSLFCLLELRGLLEAILLCQQLSSMQEVSFDAHAS